MFNLILKLCKTAQTLNIWFVKSLVLSRHSFLTICHSVYKKIAAMKMYDYLLIIILTSHALMTIWVPVFAPEINSLVFGYGLFIVLLSSL